LYQAYLLPVARIVDASAVRYMMRLNYFDGRFNNRFAEGVNLKIKLLNRRG
jgi:transposase